MRTHSELKFVVKDDFGYASGVICPAYLGRSMIRSVDGSGANDRLLWDATEPRGIRKVEPRSPARRSAESSHRPGRRVARQGSKATGWLRRADADRDGTGTPRVRFAGTAWECSYVLSLRVSPKSSQVGLSTWTAPEATGHEHLQTLKSCSTAHSAGQKQRAAISRRTPEKFAPSRLTPPGTEPHDPRLQTAHLALLGLVGSVELQEQFR
jgi:hypothetical protein